MSLIEVNHVRKVFETNVRRSGRFGALRSLISPEKREVVGVEDISFSIERGESVAYLGPNGAGKSTTIKMLTGILEPSGGDIRVAGRVPTQNRKLSSYQIGVVFGQRSQLLFDLPVQDSFDMLRYMYSIPWERYHKNLKDFSDVLEVGHLLKRPVRTLSLGLRMRCEILAALLHEPEILFLDEPTIGLDVVAKERIRSFIQSINREKDVTVLLTTHDMHDIERLCSRTMIIDKGSLIYDGSLQYIKDHFATERQIRAVFPDAQAAIAAAGVFAGMAEVSVHTEEQVIKVTYDQHRTDTSELLRLLLQKADPRDLTMQDENIDALISRIYREGIEVKPKADYATVGGIKQMMQAVERMVGMSQIAVRQRMQFRFDFIMTLLSTLMFSVMYYMLWKAIYLYSTDTALPWEQLITYVMVGQAINFARWSPAERAPTYAMAQRVKNGDIVLDLIRPVDFQTQRFLEAAGFFIVEMLWVNIPAMLLLIFILGVSPPVDITAALGFGISLCIGFLVAFSINSIIMMISFITTNTFGVQLAKRAVVDIFAGTLIPFEFFPDTLRKVMEYLPFQSMAYIPLSIYTGRLTGWDMVQSLLEQLGWAVVMILISRLLWMKAAKRLTINGG